MKKNVWILNHYAGDMFYNKGGRHYWFAKYLKREGYAPVVFCCNTKHGFLERFIDTEKLWIEQNAKEIDVPFVFVKSNLYTGNGKQRVLNMVVFYNNVKKAAKEYAKIHGKPDVIYASSVHPLTLVAGLQLAKHFKVKCICEVRDLWPESIVAYSTRLTKENPLIKLLYVGEKWIYKKADAIIMTWPGGYDYICQQGWSNQIPQNKVVHISNGVDIKTFEDDAKFNFYEDDDLKRTNKIKFVYTGSIRKVNNIKLLVDAATLLKQRGNEKALILVFGDGDERQSLESIVEERNLDNICFKGKVPKTSIPSVLVQSDVSLLHNSSSILDKYGQSQNKFFEYLAVGHPILMTYSVGHSIIRKEKCGLEIDCQNADSIADAIDYFCNLKSEDYERFCLSAKKCADRFDFMRLTKKLIEVIESC